jgi:4-hydroxy-tetrahydrodipicolinate synthase
MKTDISGVGVALVTPFDAQGKIDYKALGRVVSHVTEGGADYLVVLGTTGETPTLKPAEKKAIVEFVKEHNAGRLPVVVGCGGYDTDEVLAAMDSIGTQGVSALLSVAPYYNKPSQEGLYRHFRKIADHAPVPVIVYNIPGRTGVNISSQTILRIARDGNVMGVKEACGAMSQMMELLVARPEGFKVISGDDAMALPLAAVGGDGVISVAANAYPRQVCDMMGAAAKGDYELAGRLCRQLYPVFEAMFAEGNPTGAKTALAAMGIIEPNFRLPMIEGSQKLMDFFRGVTLS